MHPTFDLENMRKMFHIWCLISNFEIVYWKCEDVVLTFSNGIWENIRKHYKTKHKHLKSCSYASHIKLEIKYFRNNQLAVRDDSQIVFVFGLFRLLLITRKLKDDFISEAAKWPIIPSNACIFGSIFSNLILISFSSNKNHSNGWVQSNYP